MNRADIQTIAEFLALFDTGSNTVERFIDDIFNELGVSPAPRMLKAEIQALTASTGEYAYLTDMLSIFTAFFDGSQIHIVPKRELEAYTNAWRSEEGTPEVLTHDEVSARNYTVFPIPDTTSDALIPIHGQPLGEDYPDNSLVLIYADNREQGISDIFSLPIAFSALSREFNYPSDHTDLEFSGICSKLSKALFNLIGIKDA